MDAAALKALQAPLKDTYREKPEAAVVTLKAEGNIGEGVTCSVKTGKALVEVPGPSTNPATNLLILDIAMRGASLIAGRLIEKGTLRTRYTAEKAADIVKGRSMAQTLVATGAARIATRSVPGLLLVAGGLFAKAAFDRSQSRRKARRVVRPVQVAERCRHLRSPVERGPSSKRRP